MSIALRGVVAVVWGAACGASVVLGGCLQSGSEPAGPGAELKLAVAPLNLPGIGEACYDIRVTNAAGSLGDVVWQDGDPWNGMGASTVGAAQSEGAICSGQYGNGAGGDIAIVGPCDAGTAEPHTHTVTVWFENLYLANGSELNPGDWDNPCPSGPGMPGCSREFQCAENADTEVTFNFTVLRAANQGFFDVAVNFEDIFCSAKLDCSHDDNHNGNVDPGEEIKLLFNGADRDTTAVIGLACTAGPSNNDTTTLHVSDVRVHCGDTGAQQTMPTFVDPMLCAPDGTYLGGALGLLRQNLDGLQKGSMTISGTRILPNGTQLPVTLPTPGHVWGFAANDPTFQGTYPELVLGDYSSGPGSTGPRVATLLLNLAPGKALQSVLQSSRVGIGWIAPGAQGDVTY